MDVFPLKRLYSTVANMTQARAIVYIDEYLRCFVFRVTYAVFDAHHHMCTIVGVAQSIVANYQRY